VEWKGEVGNEEERNERKMEWKSLSGMGK
jgi:hypothetical protein